MKCSLTIVRMDHYIDRKKDPYYGYDGVCLFKYFVDKSDHQIGFV